MTERSPVKPRESDIKIPPGASAAQFLHWKTMRGRFMLAILAMLFLVILGICVVLAVNALLNSAAESERSSAPAQTAAIPPTQAAQSIAPTATTAAINTTTPEASPLLLSNRSASKPERVIVADFQGGQISLADYERVLAMHKAVNVVRDPSLDFEYISNQESLQNLQMTVLQSYMNKQLILAEMRNKAIVYDFSDAQISERVKTMLRQDSSGGLSEILKKLRHYGISEVEFKVFVKDMLAIERYLDTTVLQGVITSEREPTFKRWLEELRAAKQVRFYMSLSARSDEALLQRAERAGLEYYRQKYGGNDLTTAIVTDFGSHIQISIVQGEYIVRELGYARDTNQVYELTVQPK